MQPLTSPLKLILVLEQIKHHRIKEGPTICQLLGRKILSKNHMPPKDVSTQCSSTTTSQCDSQPIGNPTLGSQVSIIPQGDQPNCLECLTQQVHELVAVVQAIQHPTMSTVSIVAPRSEEDQAMSSQTPTLLGATCLEPR